MLQKVENSSEISEHFFEEREPLLRLLYYFRAFAAIGQLTEIAISILDRVEDLRNTQVKFSESPDPTEIFFFFFFAGTSI